MAELQNKEGFLTASGLDGITASFRNYRDGKIDYENFAEEALRSWAIGLTGIPYDYVLAHTREFVTGQLDKFYPFVNKVFEELRRSHNIYLVTTEPQFVAYIVQELLGIHGFLSTEFEVKDGFFTGKIKSMLAKRIEKLAVLSLIFNLHDQDKSLAFGDSEADIEMLNLVDLAVCINPTPVLREHALAKGWKMVTLEDAEKVILNLIFNDD